MKSFFSPGVVDIRMNESGQEEAFVKNARLDANTREVYRHQEYRVSDFLHFRSILFLSLENKMIEIGLG